MKTRTIMVVKVGTEDRPASVEDIEEVKKALEDGFAKGTLQDNITLICHHAIQFETVAIPVDDDGKPMILALGVSSVKVDGE